MYRAAQKTAEMLVLHVFECMSAALPASFR